MTAIDAIRVWVATGGFVALGILALHWGWED